MLLGETIVPYPLQYNLLALGQPRLARAVVTAQPAPARTRAGGATSDAHAALVGAQFIQGDGGAPAREDAGLSGQAGGQALEVVL